MKAQVPTSSANDLLIALEVELQLLSAHPRFSHHFASAQLRLEKEMGEEFPASGEGAFAAIMIAAGFKNNLKKYSPHVQQLPNYTHWIPRAKELLADAMRELQEELFHLSDEDLP